MCNGEQAVRNLLLSYNAILLTSKEKLVMAKKTHVRSAEVRATLIINKVRLRTEYNYPLGQND